MYSITSMKYKQACYDYVTRVYPSDIMDMVQYLDYIGHLYTEKPAAPMELRALGYLYNYRLKNAALPGYCAWLPSSSSIRRS